MRHQACCCSWQLLPVWFQQLLLSLLSKPCVRWLFYVRWTWIHTYIPNLRWKFCIGRQYKIFWRSRVAGKNVCKSIWSLGNRILGCNRSCCIYNLRIYIWLYRLFPPGSHGFCKDDHRSILRKDLHSCSLGLKDCTRLYTYDFLLFGRRFVCTKQITSRSS